MVVVQKVSNGCHFDNQPRISVHFCRFTLPRARWTLDATEPETPHATRRHPHHTSVSTLYLSAPEAVELIRRKGLAACLAGIAANITEDFLRWESFDKSARVASYSPDGAIELMPIADDATYTFKYVNGHPKNTRLGLSTVMAFGVLADVATGTPQLLSELTLTTALRTAAMSAVAAKALARPGSRVMALIGNGAQSEFQALAFQHLVGITEVRLYDTDPAATAKLQANLQPSGLVVTVCGSTAEAVRGADIVTTVTADKTRATILTADMVAPGMHINAVGATAPARPSCRPRCSRAAACSSSTRPRPASKARSSRCRPTLP